MKLKSFCTTKEIISPKLNQEEIDLNKPKQARKSKLQSEIFQQTKAQDQMASQLNSTKSSEKS